MSVQFPHISEVAWLPSLAGKEHALRRRAVTAMFAAAACLAAAGCSRGDASGDMEDPQDVLVMVGDSALTMRDVQRRIPPGLSPEDSASLFRSIVDGWLERMLLSDIGAQNIDDMERIDRLVEDYRKKLIVSAYRRNLRESRSNGVSDRDVDRYYDAHKDELTLESPVTKGLYVKIPADSERLSDVRRWMMTATSDAIDNLEQYGLKEAVEYSFFEDSWIPWTTIARQVPYHFGNADDFVSSHRDFETTYRGMTYLIHISRFLPSGEPMPREVADPIIRERLETLRGDQFEQELIANIYQQALKEGRLRFIGLNPLENDR